MFPNTAADWYEAVQVFDKQMAAAQIEIDGKWLGVLIQEELPPKPYCYPLTWQIVKRLQIDMDIIRQKIATL